MKTTKIFECECKNHIKVKGKTKGSLMTVFIQKCKKCGNQYEFKDLTNLKLVKTVKTTINNNKISKQMKKILLTILFWCIICNIFPILIGITTLFSRGTFIYGFLMGIAVDVGLGLVIGLILGIVGLASYIADL